MRIFKGSRTQWFVVCENRQEKKEVLDIIGKREPFSTYFYPNGDRHEQFSVTGEEVDVINEQIRPKHGGGARRS